MFWGSSHLHSKDFTHCTVLVSNTDSSATGRCLVFCGFSPFFFFIFLNFICGECVRVFASFHDVNMVFVDVWRVCRETISVRRMGVAPAIYFVTLNFERSGKCSDTSSRFVSHFSCYRVTILSFCQYFLKPK